MYLSFVPPTWSTDFDDSSEALRRRLTVTPRCSAVPCCCDHCDGICKKASPPSPRPKLLILFQVQHKSMTAECPAQSIDGWKQCHRAQPVVRTSLPRSCAAERLLWCGIEGMHVCSGAWNICRLFDEAEMLPAIAEAVKVSYCHALCSHCRYSQFPSERCLTLFLVQQHIVATTGIRTG